MDKQCVPAPHLLRWVLAPFNSRRHLTQGPVHLCQKWFDLLQDAKQLSAYMRAGLPQRIIPLLSDVHRLLN